MAFLDNSGDIILDAVLTETGRKRMTEGNFSISKFAIGDDEINYTQYNKSHASGSAYFDLEIMQTPVFEALTETAASINYGLLGITRTDILYLPSIAVNTKNDVVKNDGAQQQSGSLYIVSVNSETQTQINTEATRTGSPLNGFAAPSQLAGSPSTPAIYFESGLNTSGLAGTSANRASNIVNMNMLDTSFTVKVPSLFISDVYQAKSTSTFYNDSTTTYIDIGLVNVGSATAATDLDSYNSYTVRGINDLMYDMTVGSVTDYSALAGPRGTMGALKFAIVEGLASMATGTRSQLWTDYGKTDQIVFGGSRKFDYIDTIVYVQGDFSSATLQIPIRIMRYAGT